MKLLYKKAILILALFSVFSFIPMDSFIQTGKASYYSDKLQGRKTSSGEAYNKTLYTGAHRTLPFGTLVRVTNIANDKSVIVKINDRGPYSHERIIDVSKAAAIELGLIQSGIIRVQIEVVPDIETTEPEEFEIDTTGAIQLEDKYEE